MFRNLNPAFFTEANHGFKKLPKMNRMWIMPEGSMVLMQFDIRRLDVYRKVPKDLTQPTYVGAFISIASVTVTLFLFVSELFAFLTPELQSVMYVDDPGHDQLPVSLDISLPELKCEVLGIDIQDDMGRHEVGNFEKLNKDPIEDAKGCRIRAFFQINKMVDCCDDCLGPKATNRCLPRTIHRGGWRLVDIIVVPGNFHVSTHAKGGTKNPSFKHVINSLRFGSPIGAKINRVYGMHDTSFEPLDGVNYTSSTLSGRETYDYHIKIVPSIFYDGNHGPYRAYQFTALQKKYEATSNGVRLFPAIWFKYQLTPITVKYTLKPKPLYHFITTVCAIVGGTFTVAGIIDSCIFTAHEVFKKIEMGKLG